MNIKINLPGLVLGLAKAAQICFVVALALSILLPAIPAHAAPGHSVGPGQDPPGAEQQVVSTFKKLAQMFISIAYSLLFILFAIGTVRTGLVANAAQQFGATGKVSVEFMNFAGGIVVFVFGLLTLPLVNWIISELADVVPADYTINVPGY